MCSAQPIQTPTGKRPTPAGAATVVLVLLVLTGLPGIVAGLQPAVGSARGQDHPFAPVSSRIEGSGLHARHTIATIRAVRAAQRLSTVKASAAALRSARQPLRSGLEPALATPGERTITPVAGGVRIALLNLPPPTSRA